MNTTLSEASTDWVPGLALPVTLAVVAGFVDVSTFLAFYGFFVAQATGSFVVAGSELVTRNPGFAIKVLAIPVFIAAGMVTTAVVRIWRGGARSALVAGLAIEMALLVGLATTGLAGVGGEIGTVPALFGLAAMGVQSATARLLLSGYGSTNVMTTNTTQLSIDLADSLMARRAVPRLHQTGLIMLGFLVGIMLGGAVFAAIGLGSVWLAIAVLVVVALAVAKPLQLGNIRA